MPIGENNKHKTDLHVYCPDGFANQLRLLLAGSFLRLSGSINSYTQEWVLNNHNNVNFLDYFIPLPKVTLGKLDVEERDKITSTTFQMMIKTFTQNLYDYKTAFDIVIKYLLPLPETDRKVAEFADCYDLSNTLGIHVRRSCKLALLNDAHNRQTGILTNLEILRICERYKNIYLATDNRETQDFFKAALGDKLIYYQPIQEGCEKFVGEYDRNLVERFTTPLHTIMDFLILQRCGVFLGTNESFFSILIYYIRKCVNDFYLFGRI
jgi:hypothetical protein